MEISEISSRLRPQAVRLVIYVVGLGTFAFNGLTGVGEDSPSRAVVFYEQGLKFEGENRRPLALAAFTKAVELDPKHAAAYFSRSGLYDGCPSLKDRDYARAVADLTKVLEILPNDFAARFNRALDYESLREFDKAIADYDQVIAGDTDFRRAGDGREKSLAQTYHYRGRVYQWYKGDFTRAVADYSQALGLDPEIEMVRYRRGQTWHALKDYARADEDYAVAIQSDPDYPNLLQSWAWQLAICPDSRYRNGKKALELATRANEMSGGKRPECLDTLAAAYAECGQFDRAAEIQKQAIELLAAKPDDRRRAMEDRLKLYEADQEFHEE